MFDALASSMRSTGSSRRGGDDDGALARTPSAEAAAASPDGMRSVSPPPRPAMKSAMRRRSSRMMASFRGMTSFASPTNNNASTDGDGTNAPPVRRRASRAAFKKRKSRHVVFGEEIAVEVHTVERKRASMIGNLFYNAKDILQFKDDKFEEEAEEQRLEKERQKEEKRKEKEAKKAERKAKLAARRAKRGATGAETATTDEENNAGDDGGGEPAVVGEEKGQDVAASGGAEEAVPLDPEEEKRLEKEREKAERKAKMAARKAKREGDAAAAPDIYTTEKDETDQAEADNGDSKENTEEKEAASSSPIHPESEPQAEPEPTDTQDEPEPTDKKDTSPPSPTQEEFRESMTLDLDLDLPRVSRPSFLYGSLDPYHSEESTVGFSEEISMDFKAKSRKSLFDTMEDSVTLELKKKQKLSEHMRDFVDNAEGSQLDLSLKDQQNGDQSSASAMAQKQSATLSEEAKMEEEQEQQKLQPLSPLFEEVSRKEKVHPSPSAVKSIAALEEEAQQSVDINNTNSLKMTDDSENYSMQQLVADSASPLTDNSEGNWLSQRLSNDSEDYRTSTTKTLPSLMKPLEGDDSDPLLFNDDKDDPLLGIRSSQKADVLNPDEIHRRSMLELCEAMEADMSSPDQEYETEDYTPMNKNPTNRRRSLQKKAPSPPQPPVELPLPPSPTTERLKVAKSIRDLDEQRRSRGRIHAPGTHHHHHGHGNHHGHHHSSKHGHHHSHDNNNHHHNHEKHGHHHAEDEHKRHRKLKKKTSLGKAISRVKKFVGLTKKKGGKKQNQDECSDAVVAAEVHAHENARHNQQQESSIVPPESRDSNASNASSVNSSASTLTDYNSVHSSQSSTGSFMAYDWGQQQYQKHNRSSKAVLAAVPEVEGSESASEAVEGSLHSSQQRRNRSKILEEASEATLSLIEELERPRRQSSLMFLMKKFIRDRKVENLKKTKKDHHHHHHHHSQQDGAKPTGMSVSASSQGISASGDSSYYDWNVHEHLKTQPRERTGSYLGRLLSGRASSSKNKARKQSEEKGDRRDKFLATQRAEEAGGLGAQKDAKANTGAFTGPLHVLVEMES